MDMKLGSLFKLEKRNMTKPKKFDEDIILVNHDGIMIFP